MPTTWLAGLGAFLSGAGAIAGSWFTLRRIRRVMREECDERIEAYKQGIEMGRQLTGSNRPPPPTEDK